MNTNTLYLAYTSSTTKSYWCHLCKKEFNKIFIENIDIQCRFCSNNFCEEINLTEDLEQHPSTFIPYQSSSNTNINTNTNNNNLNANQRPNTQNTSSSAITGNSLFNLVMTTRSNRPRTTSSLLDMIFNLLRERNTEENNMENIINYIMQNDPNRYGNPPASKSVLDSLERITVNEFNLSEISKEISSSSENNCSVCKDNFEFGNIGLKLPCKHFFHEECIMPWLKERNSCPTCRFELPTDDADYEARRNNNVNVNITN